MYAALANLDFAEHSNIFGLEVVKAMINFRWKYVKKAIV